jgi:hypothetical protein
VALRVTTRPRFDLIGHFEKAMRKLTSMGRVAIF